ncbi:MAG: hypothetical protein KME06_19420 [Kastovskya adunca ATA6-11-RM4]|nr:hypothetical protein [Kastovskya adunca ATA6-11-RM4]
MNLRNLPLDWETNPKSSYIPILYQGEIVGFCKPKHASRIVEALNEDEKLRKALKLACLDLLDEINGDITQAEALMKKYMKVVSRPKYGTAAIAALLRDRQKELDLSDQEFFSFCDSYRLYSKQLGKIFAGTPVEDDLLLPLSRILGLSIDRIISIRDGNA